MRLGPWSYREWPDPLVPNRVQTAHSSRFHIANTLERHETVSWMQTVFSRLVGWFANLSYLNSPPRYAACHSCSRFESQWEVDRTRPRYVPRAVTHSDSQ